MAAFFSALAALPAHWGALLPPRAPTHSGSGDSTAIPAHSSTGNSGKGSTEGSEGASTGTSAGSSTEGSAAGNFEKGRVASEVVEEGREESGTGHESGEGQASSVPPVGPPPSRAVTVETLTVSIAAATAAFAVSGTICAHQAGTKTARECLEPAGDPRCSPTVHCSLFTAHYSVLSAHCTLLTVHCFQLIVHAT